MIASLRPTPWRRWVHLSVALLVVVWLADVALAHIGSLPGLISRGAAPFPLQTATRDGRWRQDVLFLTSQLPSLHRNAFFQTTEQRFQAQAASLAAAVPTSDDVTIMLGMAALAASLGDGHTYVELADPRRLHTFPLRLMWFGDDLVVIGDGLDYWETLGARVSRIGDTPIAAALEAV